MERHRAGQSAATVVKNKHPFTGSGKDGETVGLDHRFHRRHDQEKEGLAESIKQAGPAKS